MIKYLTIDIVNFEKKNEIVFSPHIFQGII
jgi:hypothetical protein